MLMTVPKLPLLSEERVGLRKHKVKLCDIAQMSINQLAEALQCSEQRAQYIRALAQFQSIPSIGPKLAERVVSLGYYSLEEMKNEDGAELIDRLESQLGYWEDPCAEDCFRCIVHHANHPQSEKSWFDFTEERKQYRKKNGYPPTRPKRAWYENKKME